MKKVLALWLLALPASTLFAASVPEPVSGDCVLRDFRFVSGESLPTRVLRRARSGSFVP